MLKSSFNSIANDKRLLCILLVKRPRLYFALVDTESSPFDVPFNLHNKPVRSQISLILISSKIKMMQREQQGGKSSTSSSCYLTSNYDKYPSFRIGSDRFLTFSLAWPGLAELRMSVSVHSSLFECLRLDISICMRGQEAG